MNQDVNQLYDQFKRPKLSNEQKQEYKENRKQIMAQKLQEYLSVIPEYNSIDYPLLPSHINSYKNIPLQDMTTNSWYTMKSTNFYFPNPQLEFDQHTFNRNQIKSYTLIALPNEIQKFHFDVMFNVTTFVYNEGIIVLSDFICERNNMPKINRKYHFNKNMTPEERKEMQKIRDRGTIIVTYDMALNLRGKVFFANSKCADDAISMRDAMKRKKKQIVQNMKKHLEKYYYDYCSKHRYLLHNKHKANILKIMNEYNKKLPLYWFA